MKNVVKKIFLLTSFVLILLIAVFNDRLVTFANEVIYEFGELYYGDTFKSGDTFKMNTNGYYCDSLYITLKYEDNGTTYSTGYDVASGKLYSTDDNYYYERFYTPVNADAFAQTTVGTLPTVNGKSLIWSYEPQNDSVWYCISGIVLVGEVPKEHKEPTYKLDCEADTVSYGEKVKCSVSVDYYYTITATQFDILSDDFKIGDIKTEKNWFASKNVYVSYGIPENDSLDSTKNAKILTFTVTPKEDKELNVKDAIVIDKITYEDIIASGEHVDLTAPMKVSGKVIPTTTKKVDKDEKIENPETGVEDYIVLGVVVLVIGSVAFIQLRRKNLFKGI